MTLHVLSVPYSDEGLLLPPPVYPVPGFCGFLPPLKLKKKLFLYILLCLQLVGQFIFDFSHI